MEKRNFKNGKEIKNVVKAFNVILKNDLEVGKLSLRGKNGDETYRMFSKLNVKETIPAGTKVCLRYATIGIDDIKVHVHGYGWTSIQNFTDVFTSTVNKMDFDKLIGMDYYEFSNKEKVEMWLQHKPEIINDVQLTISEKLVVMNLQGIELAEGVKQLNCDKSLQYKVKKNMEQHFEKILNKFENQVDNNLLNIKAV